MADAPVIDPDAVAANIAHVRERIALAGGTGRTSLVAVTKGFGADAVRAAVAGGADAIGENYAQELQQKLVALGGPPPRPLHFIGQIQRNKVRAIVDAVDLWHSIDRVEVGREIARRRPGAAVLVQVNLTTDPSRGGVAPEALDPTVDALRVLGLDVRGLMGVGPIGGPAAARPGFTMLARRADALGLVELSMGMSDDLEVAVECGATLVRVGRALFGPRPVHA